MDPENQKKFGLRQCFISLERVDIKGYKINTFKDERRRSVSLASSRSSPVRLVRFVIVIVIDTHSLLVVNYSMFAFPVEHRADLVEVGAHQFLGNEREF